VVEWPLTVDPREPDVRRTALTATALLAALALFLPAAAAAAPTGGTDHMDQALVERARVAMDELGKPYGTTVGHGDLYWFAQMLDVPVGTHVNDGDLRQLVAQAERRVGSQESDPYRDLAPRFAPLGQEYGTHVNAGDVLRLGRVVGVPTAWPPTAVEAAAIDQRAGDRIAEPHPVVLRWSGVELRLPSTGTELIGFHQANHDGARNLDVVGGAVPSIVLESRNRGTGLRSAADIVAAPGVPIVAPVTGRVVRAGTYVLYCRHSDDYLVVEPDRHPGIEVKMLHIDGVSVRAGDRVVAGETVVARGPTPLPFSSQVDDSTHWRDWPHVHVEVVDTSIPDRPNPGGGGGC